MSRELSQQEIDAVFQGSGEAGRDAIKAATFDFGRLDRIPKSQLRALHLVHKNFVRSLAPSLSSYLRSHFIVNLVSLEQISYGEFLEGLASPTCIADIGLQPYDGTAVMELNLGLMFRLIELLLGSKGPSTLVVQRKITDIEKNLLQTVMLVILRDLSDTWKSVADISFSVQSLGSEPQLLQVLAPAEAVIVIAIELRVGSTSGLMNFAVPSIFIKRLRNKFDQLQQVRRAESTEEDQLHLAQLIQYANLALDVRINGGRISTRTLFDLDVDDVLILDHPADREVSGFLNGQEKWLGNIIAKNEKMAFQLKQVVSKKPKCCT